MTSDEKLDKILEALARIEKRQVDLETRQKVIKGEVKELQEHEPGSFGAADFRRRRIRSRSIAVST
jgi:hypothetical protein